MLRYVLGECVSVHVCVCGCLAQAGAYLYGRPLPSLRSVPSYPKHLSGLLYMVSHIFFHPIKFIKVVSADQERILGKTQVWPVAVFQNIRYGKNLHAKKSLDRLSVTQKEVQTSVNEVDRTKRVYFSEESDALEVASKAQDAELKAKGKKKDVR